MEKKLIWIVACGALMSGCPGTTPEPEGDGGTSTDAGQNQDAGEDPNMDAGSVDDAGVSLEGAWDGRCSLDSRVGGFVVKEQETFVAVSGQVSDGVLPISILETFQTEGSCSLLKRNNPFCEVPCAGNETCDFGGTCIPFPLSLDVGTVEILGLVQTVSMEAQSPGNTYFDTGLPNPAFAEGDDILLRYGQTELHGGGLTPLVVTTSDISISETEPLDILWASAGEEDARVRFALNIDQHGNSPLTLVCSWEDTGSATVSPTLINALISSGVTGFPRATMTRETADSVQQDDGCVEFLVQSDRSIENINIDGHTPCLVNQDCPEGDTCNLMLNTCVSG